MEIIVLFSVLGGGVLFSLAIAALISEKTEPPQDKRPDAKVYNFPSSKE